MTDVDAGASWRTWGHGEFVAAVPRSGLTWDSSDRADVVVLFLFWEHNLPLLQSSLLRFFRCHSHSLIR